MGYVTSQNCVMVIVDKIHGRKAKKVLIPFRIVEKKNLMPFVNM